LESDIVANEFLDRRNVRCALEFGDAFVLTASIGPHRSANHNIVGLDDSS